MPGGKPGYLSVFEGMLNIHTVIISYKTPKVIPDLLIYIKHAA